MIEQPSHQANNKKIHLIKNKKALNCAFLLARVYRYYLRAFCFGAFPIYEIS
jgi:hypothetical protein